MILDTTGAYRLLANVYRLAINDAQGGCVDALGFLDETFPEWQQLQQRYAAQQPPETPKMKRQYAKGDKITTN